MRKGETMGKIFGIALVHSMVGMVFGRTALAMPSLAVKNGAWCLKKVK